jgi:hypothetical protein
VQDDIGDMRVTNPANHPIEHPTSAQPVLLAPLPLWRTQSARNRGSIAERSVVGATARSHVLMRCTGFGEIYVSGFVPAYSVSGLPTLVLSCKAAIYGALEIAFAASGTRYALIAPDITFSLLESIQSL